MGQVVTVLVALLVGFVAGWFGHRRVWTWCSRCTRPVGSVCGACIDRERQGHLAQGAEWRVL